MFMKEYILAANRIIVSPDEIRDPRALRLYHRLFKMGGSDALDPLIVANPLLSCREAVKVEGCKRFYELVDQKEGDARYLFDGYHRGLAGVLAGINEFMVVELENDAEVSELRRRYQEGSIISLPYCFEEDFDPRISG